MTTSCVLCGRDDARLLVTGARAVCRACIAGLQTAASDPSLVTAVWGHTPQAPRPPPPPLAVDDPRRTVLELNLIEARRRAAAEPREVRWHLHIGEIAQRLGRVDLDAYTRAADLYVDDGFFLKAIAVAKQILVIAPTATATRRRIAGLYQQLGYRNQALTEALRALALTPLDDIDADLLAIVLEDAGDDEIAQLCARIEESTLY